MNVSEPRLGVDFGRVIQGGPDPTGERPDTGFIGVPLERAVASPATPGAMEILPGLVELFGGRVWIISKCGDSVRRKTMAWLAHQDFYAHTGMPEGNVRFCRARPEKAGHCADLGITHMIDDRLDVHEAIRKIVPYRLLFGPQQPQPAPDWVIPVLTWADVAEVLRTQKTPSP